MWVAYTDFAWIAKRHGITNRDKEFKMASEVISSITSTVKPQEAFEALKPRRCDEQDQDLSCLLDRAEYVAGLAADLPHGNQGEQHDESGE